MLNLTEISNYAQKAYDDANCVYGENKDNYFYHIKMVSAYVRTYKEVFKDENDFEITMAAALCHDLIEDAKQTYNNIAKIANNDVAAIVLAVTDVPEENRLLRHLYTMGKTVKDYRAIILKMADISANAFYSKQAGSSMYKKYVEEYEYRKPIFKKALTWYDNKLNQEILNQFWNKLDSIHNNN